MENERDDARREIRELAEIEEPTDEDIDWWLAQAERRRLEETDLEASSLILEHGRLAHHYVDGQLIGARTILDDEQRKAEVERLMALRERILDINRPWRRLFRRTRR
jgi:hypothetical protein